MKSSSKNSRVYTERNNELIDSLNDDIESAGTIKIIVSFIMESGVKRIEECLDLQYIGGDIGRRVYVGSSNISRMGLIIGLEWNYINDEKNDWASLDRFEAAFDTIFGEESEVMDMDFLRNYLAD